MPENGTTDIKVQIAGLKKDIENVNTLNGRLDTAIEIINIFYIFFEPSYLDLYVCCTVFWHDTTDLKDS